MLRLTQNGSQQADDILDTFLKIRIVVASCKFHCSSFLNVLSAWTSFFVQVISWLVVICIHANTRMRNWSWEMIMGFKALYAGRGRRNPV